uniref:Uncharacterized protein n=1 Tax=Spermophilus dauricus TaxID=99837 RepID=A0A8C9Q8P1_SPEDA
YSTSPSSQHHILINYNDKEECIPESKSNLSLSVGYFPYEDTIACEEITTCEDSASEGSSTHYLPPVQGTQKTERVRNPMGRQDEKLCKLTITLIMDIRTGSDHEDPLADGDLNRDNQRMDECPQENTELTLCKLEDVMQMLKAVEEDLHLSNSILPHMYQVSHQEYEACQTLPKWKPPENEDINQFLEMPSRLAEDELLEVNMELLDSRARDSPSVEMPTVSAEQSKEGDMPSHTETISYVNFGSIFYWLRKLVISSLPGKKHPEKITKSPSLLESKKRHFLRTREYNLMNRLNHYNLYTLIFKFFYILC